jgi:PAS domain S-box-containing protein
MIRTPVKLKAALHKEINMNKKKSEETHKNKTGSQDSANLPKQSKIEERLRESEERFRLLSEAAGEGIAIHDNGVIIEANQALSRMFGYELSEIIGRHVKNGATRESWKVIRENIETGYDKPYEMTGVRKDGSTFECSMVGKPYKYKGRTLRLSTFHDITDRKLMDMKLRREEQRFRALAEQSSDIIVFANREGIVTYENPAVEKFLGFKPEERIGVNVFDRIHPEIGRAHV